MNDAPALAATAIPKSEHPRPQSTRPDWLVLNGTWSFERDRGDSGLERGLLGRELAEEILVPFAPESTASGIGDVDFLTAVWYRRTVRVPAGWSGRRVLLHFGAVDHDATVWVGGEEVARHRGGFTSFTADLGVRADEEELVITVRARDTRDEPQARGKQATWYANTECFYTRTTGIWQTVWLEPVPEAHIRQAHIEPQLGDASFTVTPELSHRTAGLRFEAVLRDAAGEITRAAVPAGLGARVVLRIPADRVRPWSPEDPHLYDIALRLVDGTGDDARVVDEVASYGGLRSIAIDGQDLLLNGRRVFQRLVLDQGYWPDTLMTSPDDAALVRDIELSMAAGFTGARLHQKVFEERFLFHADRLGYLVWGEFGDWGAGGGLGKDAQQPTASFITQWIEAVTRDRSHPSIVGWCPLNETYQPLHDRITQLDDVTAGMYRATKAADPSRPVLDASGYSHRVPGADVYDSHSYEQDPDAFRREQAGLAEGRPFVNELNGRAMSVPYAGQPFFVSEYGGIWWNPAEADAAAAAAAEDDPERAVSWGYGERVRTVEEWHARFRGLTEVLLEDPRMFGYCYTQLTDTFQEQNGIYDAQRRPKFDIARIREVQERRAAYEMRDDA
ncbi:glycoside hydrolase family 2 protein [Clavibacter tessellarius]|uniref:Beta-galactosidase n=1 Tax=Clavibacter tessellarius TaxID=31965 RepID=A0A154UZX2_9MICO|nr:sugar-binding domain-containing protein [Clavibacter michiganensis]KZC94549.1 beta-galactosidase [Clavibacter michiganensis subsp. tessellarius]